MAFGWADFGWRLFCNLSINFTNLFFVPAKWLKNRDVNDGLEICLYFSVAVIFLLARL